VQLGQTTLHAQVKFIKFTFS